MSHIGAVALERGCLWGGRSTSMSGCTGRMSDVCYAACLIEHIPLQLSIQLFMVTFLGNSASLQHYSATPCRFTSVLFFYYSSILVATLMY